MQAGCGERLGGLPKVEVGHLLGAPGPHLATGPKAMFHDFDKYLWSICSVLGITRLWRRAGKETRSLSVLGHG